ncbi:FxLD family lanthipeptide [Streptomyces sp. NPDC091289]|uniref:FxLD family lanthipeptide n=1 Tax=Streptomyces sp. NPDC091289 TaxID=3365989 RepID=UPI003821933F
MATPTTETKPRSNNSIQPIAGEEWELDIVVTDAPRPIVTDCGTGDGCASTCASSCAS